MCVGLAFGEHARRAGALRRRPSRVRERESPTVAVRPNALRGRPRAVPDEAHSHVAGSERADVVYEESRDAGAQRGLVMYSFAKRGIVGAVQPAGRIDPHTQARVVDQRVDAVAVRPELVVESFDAHCC